MTTLVIFFTLFMSCQALAASKIPQIRGYSPTQTMKIPIRILVLKEFALMFSLLEQRNSLRDDIATLRIVACMKTRKKPLVPCLLDVFKFREFHHTPWSGSGTQRRKISQQVCHGHVVGTNSGCKMSPRTSISRRSLKRKQHFSNFPYILVWDYIPRKEVKKCQMVFMY